MILPTKEELLAAGCPYGKTKNDFPEGDNLTEWTRTDPDYVIYLPMDRATFDNVHITVIDRPCGGLQAFWTQSTLEGHGDNRIVTSFSDDGKRWTTPKMLLGCPSGGAEKQASWSFPVVTGRGRIYLFYFRETDFVDFGRQLTGRLACIVSDDSGETWSESADLPPLPKTPYDLGDPAQNNCVWQQPIALPEGKWLVGMTKWTGPTMHPRGPMAHQDARSYFLRFENLEEHPAAEDIRVTLLPEDPAGLVAPNPFQPATVSVLEEAAPVLLPDGRLMATFRTLLKAPYYAVSEDGGRTWTKPAPLHFTDGTEIPHPRGPAPLWVLPDGRYLLLYHGLETDNPTQDRDPVNQAVGVFDPAGEQPIAFDRKDTKELMRLNGVCIGGKPIPSLAMYSTLHTFRGETVLWYPDRKHYMLGKIIRT